MNTIPTPPVYSYIPENVLGISIFLIVAAMIALVFAARHSYKTKDILPFMVSLGGTFFFIPEAINCYVNHIYWTVSPDPRLSMGMFMGANLNIHVFIVWAAYVAVVGYSFYRALEDGWSEKKLWQLLGLSWLADFFVECLMLGMGGMYVYYGNQPLQVMFGVPLWWMFMNNAALFLGVSIVYRLREQLKGWRSIAVLAILPLVYVGSDLATAMPTSFAINSDYSWYVTQLLGVVTCLLCVALAKGTIKIVLNK